MAEYFSESKQAFDRNEKRRAKELSLMGQAHKENMVRLDKEASAKIFQGMNWQIDSERVALTRIINLILQRTTEFVVFCRGRQYLIFFSQNVGPNTVDLHGLYVQEAKLYFEEAVQNIWNRAQPLRVIVGRKRQILNPEEDYSLIITETRKGESLQS